MYKEIMLEKRNVYGNDLIYPSCHIANALIKLKDKKKKDQELSDRLYNAENNITHLNNVNYKRGKK